MSLQSRDLHGYNLIGRETSREGDKAFEAVNPASGEKLSPSFPEASEAEVNRALELAERAFYRYREESPTRKAAFLRKIAEELEALGDALIGRASAETGLGAERLKGERARTMGQLRLFADLVEEGSWVDARIDHAMPERQPQPKPDLRRMLIPIGPVVVFGASNFPLAFSVPGGDTASALAAGCPVVAKGHPAHPGTSEMAARAILKAAEEMNMPEGIFSLVHGAGHEVGLNLVRHPKTKAVGFTGSLKGGRALFDAAASRPEPIPVYAEMGSVNPVFVLPKALAERGDGIAQGLVQSVTLGVGQFCTNPGLVVGLEDEATQRLIERTSDLVVESPPGTMLYYGICQAFSEGVRRVQDIPGVELAGQSATPADPAKTEAGTVVFTADAKTFLDNPALSEELFGPATLIVRGRSKDDLLEIAHKLEGHLTATIQGTEEELEEYRDLTAILETKVGRLLFNGFPTGVEVAHAMNHGGPYPATTDVRSTSVGTAAILRFVRPICYQGFPQGSLPAEIRDDNPRKIWRLVDGELTKL
ncbi:MAG: aldehyde dehydrogenase (NADP(+)) [Deinococcota bacterium]|nr:aldehyde dehydrogenase (NADP(+)) [Deinococcota bacterium]